MIYMLGTLAAIGLASSVEYLIYYMSLSKNALTSIPPDSFGRNGFGCRKSDSLIKLGEGYSNRMYKDSMGIPTICFGYNLKN